MFRFLFGFNWQKSPPHLLLLSKFLVPKSIGDFSKTARWCGVLQESPKRAIKRFIRENMLQRASVAGALDYTYKVSDLKAMLKKNGLKVSGRKQALIERLVQADPDGMSRKTRHVSIYECSPKGRAIAEEFLDSVDDQRDEAEQLTYEFVKSKDFEKASQVVVDFESRQVFPRDVFSNNDIQILKFIFRNKPKILGALSRKEMKTLRIATAMMQLWGTRGVKDWLPEDFETDLDFDNDTAARMFLFLATHKFNISRYKKAGFKKVEICGCGTSCNNCKKLDGKVFKINECPELPYEKCTHPLGCRCTIVVADSDF